MKIRKFVLLSIAAAALAPGLHAQQRTAARSGFATPQDAARYYENLVGRLAQQVRSM